MSLKIPQYLHGTCNGICMFKKSIPYGVVQKTRQYFDASIESPYFKT